MPRAACWRTPPPPAWCSRSRAKPKRKREPPASVDSSSHSLSSGGVPKPVVSDGLKPLTFGFKNDRLVPNNPLPLLGAEDYSASEEAGVRCGDARGRTAAGLMEAALT